MMTYLPAPESPSKPRSMRAAETKAAILRSARRAFADLGYDGAGLRGIAEGAGVTAMMVGRYFGSKEQLFAAVVSASMKDPVILAPANINSPSIARDMATALVGLSGPGAQPLDGFLMLFRSASSPVAARIARDQISAMHQTSAERIMQGGNHAAERSAILLSLVAGIQMMRQMIGLNALVEADPATLIDLLEPLLNEVLNAECATAPPAGKGANF